MIYTIKTLSQQGKSQRAIARELGISRITVKRHLNNIELQGVQEPKISKDKKLDAFHHIIADLYEDGQTAKLIWQKLQSDHHLKVSYITVSRYVSSLKKHGEVFVPLLSLPGEEAQVDYGYVGHFIKDGVPVKVYAFSMVLSYSRYAYYEFVTSQSVKSFINSHIHAFEYFGGVPARIKIDNLKAGVITPDFYQSTIQSQYAEFLAWYGSAPVTARVRRPQDKGKVEAGIKYLKNNFMKTVRHDNFDQLKQELKLWNDNICNQRIHGTTKKQPLQVFLEKEKKILKPLPGQRFQLYSISKRKVNGYGHVSFANNYYSVPCHLTGKELIVKSDDAILKIYDGLQQVAVHPIVKDKKGEFITIQAHKPEYKQYKGKDYYLDKAALIGPQALSLCKSIIEKAPNDYSRAISGILSLTAKYGNDVVNLACRRAIWYNAYSYLYVKNICLKGLYNAPFEDLAVKGADGYKQDLSIYDKLNFN